MICPIADIASGITTARRVSAGKHVVLANRHYGNDAAAAEEMGNAGFP